MRGLSGTHYSGVKLNPITTLEDINTGGGAVWDFAVDGTGNYLYAAATADGVYVFNITDAENPVQLTTIPFRRPGGATTTMPVTDVLVVGTWLFACGRSIDFSASSETGIIAAYDITSPGAPVWETSYQPPDADPLIRQPGTSRLNNNWYQGMATDGTYLYVASQTFGATVFDISALTTTGFIVHDTFDTYDFLSATAAYSGNHSGSNNSAILVDASANGGAGWVDDELVGARITNLQTGKIFDMICTTNDQFSVTGTLNSGSALDWDTGDPYIINTSTAAIWETSRVTASGGWVFFANHGEGVTAMQSTAGVLSNLTRYGSFAAPRIAPNTGVIQLRARDVVNDGNYIFVCTNISLEGTDVLGDLNKDGPERGLLMMDITSPGTNTNGDWYNTPIGFADREKWDGAGDQPHLGLCQFGNYAFIGNGKGVAVFDVTTRTAPVYMGTHGNPVDPEETTIYAPYVFDRGGKTYVYFADAIEANQKHNLYVTEMKVYP